MHVGLSLVLPYLEPYLIRSMRAAKAHVEDPKLAADLEAFNGQEGQHYREHKRFNSALQLAPALTALEAEIDADYRRFSDTRSLRWNLAYAEGFEAFTIALARFTIERGRLDRLKAPARALFEWHLLEELEHRTVAFDVYKQVVGGYFYRLVVGLFAQWHLVRFVTRVMNAMAGADPQGFYERFAGKREARDRQRALARELFRHFLPKLFATYLPWYTPHRIPMPAPAQAIADRYAALGTGPGC